MAEGSQTDVRCVRTEKKVEGVAELVLCRPKRLNTMTPAFFQEFKQAVEVTHLPYGFPVSNSIQAAVEDPKVNVILVRAEGRMFTAGLDLREASALMSSGTDGCNFFPCLHIRFPTQQQQPHTKHKRLHL